MWRAALPCRHVGIALLGSIVAAALVAGASPSSSAAAPAAPAGQVWALALPSSVKSVQQKQMSWLAARGVTTIVAFKRPPATLKRLAASAKKSGLVVIAPRQVAPKKACRSAGSLVMCAVVVATPAAAVRLARRGLVDYVVIRVKTPLQLRMLRGSHAKRSRILALLPLSQKAAGRNAWRSGIAYAAADPALDLGVSSAPSAVTALGGYLSQVPRTRTASAAGQTAPTALLVTGRSTSSVTLRWTAAAGGATGYGIYTDGNFVLNVTAVSITLTGLTCGRTYSFGVDAYDEGGRSARISTSTSTDPCAGGGGSADVLPPSAPLGLVKGTSTQTSIAVSWTASSDNVGVAGYGLYRNGSASGSSLVSSASFSGLACGTTYTLAVDAYDAAGNRSGKTSLSAATSACSGGGDTTAPSTPGTLTKTGSTQTSISVSWGASTDNVGVAGYGLYRNAILGGDERLDERDVRRPRLRVELHPRGRRLRRGRQPQRPEVADDRHVCLPTVGRHSGAVGAAGHGVLGRDPDLGAAGVERLDRQRRRRRLPALPERRQRRDGAHARLHVHRPDLRDRPTRSRSRPTTRRGTPPTARWRPERPRRAPAAAAARLRRPARHPATPTSGWTRTAARARVRARPARGWTTRRAPGARPIRLPRPAT